MPFLPPDAMRIADITEAENLSILDTLDNGAIRLLRAGEFAVFLSGQFVGGAFEASRSGDWTGLNITGLDVEVDTDSFVGPHMADPVMTVQRTATALTLTVKFERSSGARPITLIEGLPESSPVLRGFFTRWRLVRRHGDEVLTIYERALA